jgi:hypothetical protein
MKRRRPRYTASTADKFVLYQKAVQAPDAEIDFIDALYRREYGRTPTLLREDFSGTCLISTCWARRRRANHAYAVDLCRQTLAWGKAHNIDRLPAHAAARVHQLNANVLHVCRPKVHVVAALNFSYFILKDAPTLQRYFRTVRGALFKKGLLVLDAYGGPEAQEVMKDRTKHRGFTYIWDQAAYNPIDDRTLCHIHFRFPDGTMMRKAFSYDWRLWTLGTLQDLLRSAGFRRTHVYWEGATRKGEGNGIFRRTRKAENDPAWIAYVVALP